MSEENRQAVRTPMARTVHSRRRLEERLALRFPRFLDFLARSVWRLPKRSRPRRGLVRRLMRIAWEAFNREDLEATFMLYHPACQSTWDPRFPTIGVESTIQSRDERIRVQRRILDEWDELRFEPEEMIEVGDRLLSIGRMRGAGLRSGAVGRHRVGRDTHDP